MTDRQERRDIAIIRRAAREWEDRAWTSWADNGAALRRLAADIEDGDILATHLRWILASDTPQVDRVVALSAILAAYGVGSIVPGVIA
jgi:hypothetical protein